MAASNSGVNTLLVKNLPPDAKESKLEELFADIGPVKRCFIVRDKSQQSQCKGVAYVTYASTADAEAAVERSRQRNLKWGDRILAVKSATPKAPREPMGEVATPKKRAFTKEEKAARKKRKPRLIVRNLSFKATEKTLRDCFSKYGSVVEVTIPKKPDGKMRGFAFVQFNETKSAIKAINGLNATEVLGRPIAVDFSLPKATYQQNVTAMNSATTKLADEGGGPASPHEESEDMSDDAEKHSSGASESDNTEHSFSDMDEDDGDDESDCSADVKPDRHSKGDTKNTVFIRNLSFDSQQGDLETLMKQFGPCRYCLLCTDMDTGRSRGTAFVRFAQESSVDACLEAAASSPGIMLDGRRLDVVRALNRDELEEKQKEKKKQKKDRRNLYLAREGLVRPGTEAAQGVSPQDMTKRAKLQARKCKLLANLHYFVSPTRLSVHNLPPSVDDRKLRALFLENAPHGARITEARVMRNLKSPTAESYGYGFVTFTKHEDALAALRELNNNPGTFGPKKRPIIEFCLENKAALLAKERRLQRSKQKLKELHDSHSDEQKLVEVPLEKKAAFMGAAANKKMKGLPTHSGPKVRTKKGRAGKQKLQLKNKKGKKKLQQKPKTFVKNMRTEKDSFSTMLDKHKKVHSKQTPSVRKTKWFEN
ncbi:hypothetical protein HPB51_024858 [Rhipicephalus microplus]|uniref:RRM domain-containing protein n=1 Tax=Rhipicephalus microplus TaxID=6941 RepID=A0A9J6F6F8_RHIMP|nr:RNA-binding protein 28-like [Rhipicephalus microplus]KAH8042626.1 hypothetical protein HPB51_024858 [Rhipicephalus microplus]